MYRNDLIKKDGTQINSKIGDLLSRLNKLHQNDTNKFVMRFFKFYYKIWRQEKKTPKLSHPLNVKLLFLNNPSEQDGNTYTSTTARSENFSIPYLKFQICHEIFFLRRKK
jgi:hypothetical protein